MNEKIIVSESYTKAVALHRKITANAQVAQEALYEMCKSLKEMRDGKLYKELGYQNFEDYTQTELGFSRRNAYNYITVAENLPENFVNSSSQIGMKKLALLAKLDEPQREELQQSTDIETTSVRELKNKIKELESAKAEAKERQDKLLTKNKELVSENKTLALKLDEQNQENVRTAKQRKALLEQRDSLQKQVTELENRPRDSYEDTTKIEALEKRLEEEEERHLAELERLKNSMAKSAPDEDVKGIFKAYMTAAVDSMKRLTEFVDKHRNHQERTLFHKKMQDIVCLINQTINDLKGA